MRKLWIGASCLVIVLILLGAGINAPALAQATSTYTPTSTAAFVLPLINVPIVLPTAFMPAPPTAIIVNVTAAPNMNPYGLVVPGNPIWAWQEGINWMQAMFSAMGWIGKLLFFSFIVWMALALLMRAKNRVMGHSAAAKEESAAARQVERTVERLGNKYLR